MATTVARPMPFSWTGPMWTAAPERPLIMVTAVRIRFLGWVKSTFRSTIIRRPDAAIKPNNKMQTPPITGVGIPWITAAIFPMKENRMAKMAAPPMTQVLYTPVMAMTPMFSP